MLNAPKRSFFSTKVAPKSVTIAVSDAPTGPSAGQAIVNPIDCEVTEFDDERGWDEWQDSKFVQEFESQIDETIPMQLPKD